MVIIIIDVLKKKTVIIIIILIIIIKQQKLKHELNEWFIIPLQYNMIDGKLKVG